VRLIGSEGENRGVLATNEAISLARESGLDLVEVSPSAKPPVCRILDYGKWKYEQAKKEREARKHQRGTMVHEVRMRPRTGQHDIDMKVRIAQRLLAEGDKVKLSVMFRGREMAHPEIGREVMEKALVQLRNMAGLEKPPGMEGRFLSVILTPNATKAEVEAAKSVEVEATEVATNAKKQPAKRRKPLPTVVLSTPEAAKVAPSAEKPAAEPAKAAPSAEKPATEPAKAAPSAEKPAAEAAKAAPSPEKPTTKPAKAAASAEKPATEPAKAAPSAEKPAAEPAKVAPSAKKATTKPAKAAPAAKAAKAAPTASSTDSPAKS